MKSKIIGIMAVKNAISQGYPFLEAVNSFLGFGDKLYIEDGNSTDGTFEILKEISVNKKIKVFGGYDWSTTAKSGYAIGTAYNHVLKKVKDIYKNSHDTYLVEIQANEIFHESIYKEIKELLILYPQAIGYILPYQIMVGNYLVYKEDWRLRIIKIDFDPIIYGDGAINLRKELSFNKFIYALATASFRYIKLKSYYAQNLGRLAKFYHLVPLSKPVFRYTYIFPRNITNKTEGHARLYGNFKEYTSSDQKYIPAYIINHLSKKMLSNLKFYELLAKKLCVRGAVVTGLKPGPLTKLYTGASIRTAVKPIFIPAKYHPKSMRNLLTRKQYTINRELVRKIKGL